MTQMPLLANMTLAEKLQLMEAVWDDVCRNAGDVRSPEWHREVLEERAERIRNGEATVSTWSDAKSRLLRLGQ